MELLRFGVKFFAENPAAVRLEEFIPVFHRWIQKHTVGGLLVDVADYSHVAQGPGVLLVGHEADFYMDEAEGPLGLLYSRKLPFEGTFADRVEQGLRTALDACAKLVAEPELKGRLTFRTGEALFLANDRLAAPNTEAAFAGLKPGLETAGRKLFPKGVAVTREGADPRGRLAARLRSL